MIESFVPYEVLTNYKDIKSNIILFKKVNNFLKKYDIKYWITGNTLLGAVRHKCMIPWGYDINIAMMETEYDKLQILTRELNENNLEICDIYFGYKIFEKTGKEIKYPFINIYITINSLNILVNKNNIVNNTYNYDDVYPLKEYYFEDFLVLGPNNGINYLDINYKDWRIKDSIENSISFELHIITDKPYIWLYWDNIDNKETPGFIDLCRETVYKNCLRSFNIVLLNKDNIETFIPELKNYKTKMDKLIIAHKVDIYRIMLLYKYGGIYLDSDIIVMRDLIEIIDKLKKHEFVGFGCTGNICKSGYGRPSNWILASRPYAKIMGLILKSQLLKLDSNELIDYHDIGKILIWSSLDKLINEEDYEYYHYPNTVDGTRDINGHWITSDIVFSNTPIIYDNDINFLFYVFYNSNISNTIKKMSKKELLDKNWNFTKYVKRALKI